MAASHPWMFLGFAAFLLSACGTRYPETCPASTPIGLVDADDIAGNASLPFRFPLAENTMDGTLFFGRFGVSNDCPPDALDCFQYSIRTYHAAEDYRRPAGTPVYAMADGRISFSGPMGGYGWLIIIDHPQANLYSLYGHLSPSRRKLESGAKVQRGDWIAYLGDPDENGGSKEEPLEPHLHFGIRAGQKADYPSRGEWRFMAGWIRLCPQDLGWLQPSVVITGQEMPAGGYPQPTMGFLERWGIDLLISGVYAVSGAVFLFFAIRKNLHKMLLFPGVMTIAAGMVFYNNGLLGTRVLLIIGILLLAIGVYCFIRRPDSRRPAIKP